MHRQLQIGGNDGFLKIPEDGTYRLILNSDDGGLLRIGDELTLRDREFTRCQTDGFRNGQDYIDPLTGQSDHIVNLQLGLEDEDRLSQQTILLSYASDRVVSRGLNGTPPQPDVIESPGLRLDFVWREGFDLFGAEMEAKFEARNIFGRGHEEFQQSGDNRIDINSYEVGRSFGASISGEF